MTPPAYDVVPELLRQGLLDQPTSPDTAAHARKPRFLDRLFGSQVPPGLLTGEEQQPLGKAGLLGAGASMLDSAGKGDNIFSTLGAGLHGGSQAYAGAADAALGKRTMDTQQALTARRAQIMQKYAGRHDIDSFKAMLGDLLQIGDEAGAKSLAGYLANAVNQEGAGHKKTVLVKLKDGRQILVDAATGEPINEFGTADPNDDGLTPYQRKMLGLMGTRANSMNMDRVINDFDSQTKDMRESVSQFGLLKQALAAGGPASTLPILDMFARIYNPRAAVRSGTLALLNAKLGSLGQKIEGYVTGRLQGELPKDLRDAILKQAEQSMNEHRREFSNIRKRSLARGKATGVDTSELNGVLLDPFEEMANDEGNSDDAANAAAARALLGGK